MSDEGFKPFLCSYRFDGSEWSVTVYARSHDEAEKRLAALIWGKVDGEIKATIPYRAGFLAKMIVASKNFFTAPVP